MTTAELVNELKWLERQMSLYEEKYGVLSEDFHAALMRGALSRYDGFDETRVDFCRWNGLYQSWLQYKEEYARLIREKPLPAAFTHQPAY